MVDTKRFKLVNRQPGPRGIQTLKGVVMVQPAMEGADNGTIAELTEDELGLADAVGLEITGLEGVEEYCELTSDVQTPDLPAAGQFNPDYPGAMEALEAAVNPPDPPPEPEVEAARKAPAKEAPKSER